ncbi:hypothetical protein ACH35V_15690 [Actinomadura sp. 1N219]|uniref:hypothetical protein n=1 Tax=Actinomadura sp. 1N219 TaxID=3375152 RepID=UPI0037A65E0E
MQTRLRIYTLREGKGDEFVQRWTETLVPLRRKLGFEVLGAWRVPDRREFVWIVGWPGEGSYDDAERAYYESPLRKEIPWRAEDFIEAADIRTIEAVEGFGDPAEASRGPIL